MHCRLCVVAWCVISVMSHNTKALCFIYNAATISASTISWRYIHVICTYKLEKCQRTCRLTFAGYVFAQLGCVMAPSYVHKIYVVCIYGLLCITIVHTTQRLLLGSNLDGAWLVWLHGSSRLNEVLVLISIRLLCVVGWDIHIYYWFGQLITKRSKMVQIYRRHIPTQ